MQKRIQSYNVFNWADDCLRSLETIKKEQRHLAAKSLDATSRKKKIWKKKIFPIMNHYAEKLPGSFIEEKEYSLVFHYRRSDPNFASLRVNELTNHLMSFTANMDLQLLHGNKVLEVRNAGIDKGV